VSVKAKRKRMYKIGGKKDQGLTTPSAGGAVGASGSQLNSGRGAWPDGQEGANSYGPEGKGKERQRSRRSRRASPPGTDFDEDDMDRYFKSMQHGAD
jgi:distribution and morphology protein 34